MAEPAVLDWSSEQPAEDRLIVLTQKSYHPQSEGATAPSAPVTAPAGTEVTREIMRGAIAIMLLGGLFFVLVIPLLLTNTLNLTTDDFIAMFQSIGSAYLTPLIGLIGAVTGFYYGGQATAQTVHTAAQTAAQTAARLGEGGPTGGSR